MNSAASIFALVDQRLRAEPHRCAGITARFSFTIDSRYWHLCIENGVAEAGPGPSVRSANLEITMSEATLVDFANGRLGRLQLAMRTKTAGDTRYLATLQKILA